MIDFNEIIKQAKKITPEKYESYWAEFNEQNIPAKKLEFLQDYSFIDQNDDFNSGNLDGFCEFLKEFYTMFKGGKDNVKRIHFVTRPVSNYLQMEYYAYLVSEKNGSK